jgi:uncharacterized membrane protein (UPF0127 family)
MPRPYPMHPTLAPALRLLGLSLWLLAVSGASGCSSNPHRKPKDEPAFRHDGNLDFLRPVAGSREPEILASIAIEVADDPIEQARGLKYRSSMDEYQGMLFVFFREGPQAFWMQDTRISLDILFVNEALQIVHIAENTVPFSEQSIPSQKPARYVVEVLAGFCQRHGIRPGDYIRTQPVEKPAS